jgi:hypothetical protein
MLKASRTILGAALLLTAGAATSAASVTRYGSTAVAINAATRGSAVAYDSVHHVYLTVSTFGVLRGQFVDGSGGLLGAPFVIQASGNFTHFPAVEFSPDADGGAGAFLVVWHESDLPAGTSVHARVVSYAKSGPAGADTPISIEGSYWERYPGIAYATTSKEFLVTYPLLSRGIRAVRVGLGGAPIGAPFTIAANGQYEEWSSVAYSPTNNQFVVAYEGFSDAGAFGYIDVRAVQAGTGAVLGAGATRVFQGGADYINQIVYNPSANNFLVVWYRDAGGSAKTMLGRILNPDLSMPGDVTAVSSLWKAYDGLGLAYNRVTQSAFMVSHDNRSATSYEDGGVEVNANGTPVDNGFTVTLSPDAKPNYYPRIASSTDEGAWLMVTSHTFVQTNMQVLSGTANGPAPSPTPAPVADTPNPALVIDFPGNGTVSLPFTVSGWAADLGSSTSSGADVVHVWAWPTNGAAPIFLGATAPSLARPDVGAVAGGRFTNSGYSVTVQSLPVGSYSLSVYMHSTVNNTFNAVRTVSITVRTSSPVLWVDTPSPNSTVSSRGFAVTGWAVDLGSTAGTGIAAVHIWAFPSGGGTAIFGGAANLGAARPDIGSLFGSQFTNSGFGAMVTLPPGDYNVSVYGLSEITGTFNVVRSVPVVVQ